MTLQQLKYLLAVASNGSINAAAKQMYVSQPSISAAISSLEKEFGITIFKRTTRGIHITAEGKKLIKRANQIVKEADDLSRDYLGHSEQKQTFRICAQHYTFASEAFCRLMMVSSTNDYSFSFIETTGNNVVSSLIRNTCELGILYWTDSIFDSMKEKLDDNALVFHKLFQSKQVVMMLDSNPLAHKKMLNASDLKELPYISFEHGEFNSSYFEEESSTVFDHGRTINVSDRSDMFYFLKRLNGFTICTNMVHEALNGEHIVTVPLENTDSVTVGYVTRRDEELSKIGKKYIEICRTCIKDLLR